MPDFAVRTAFTAVDRVSPAFGRMGTSVDSFGKKASGVFSGLAGQMGIFGGVALLAMGLKKVATSAMMIEDAQASFTPLLGSVEKAKQLVEMLNVAAAETPFQFEDLAKVSKQLLPVMEGDLQNTIRTMKMLGDTAGGNAEKLDSVTRGYTKAMLKGKVDMESLNMIAEAGVPIHTELARSMGYGKDQMTQFFKKISSGTVDTKQLTQAFERMTGKGGLFFQGMIIASKTTSGVMSTMADNLTMVAAGIGEQLLPLIKDIAIAISDTAASVLEFIKNNKEMIGYIVKALPKVLGLFVAWKVYTWAVIVAQKVMVAVGWVQYLWMMRSAIMMAVSQLNLWAIAQRVINFLLVSNPIGLVITAIGVLAYAIYDLYTNWEKYQLNFQVSIQNFVTGFARAKMEVYELLNAIGLISDKELTGAKLNFLQNFTNGAKLKVEQLRANKSPNEAAANLQGNGTTVNINSNGTEAKAEITPRQGAKVNMNKLGYQN